MPGPNLALEECQGHCNNLEIYQSQIIFFCEGCQDQVFDLEGCQDQISYFGRVPVKSLVWKNTRANSLIWKDARSKSFIWEDARTKSFILKNAGPDSWFGRMRGINLLYRKMIWPNFVFGRMPGPFFYYLEGYQVQICYYDVWHDQLIEFDVNNICLLSLFFNCMSTSHLDPQGMPGDTYPFTSNPSPYPKHKCSVVNGALTTNMLYSKNKHLQKGRQRKRIQGFVEFCGRN